MLRLTAHWDRLKTVEAVTYRARAAAVSDNCDLLGEHKKMVAFGLYAPLDIPFDIKSFIIIMLSYTGFCCIEREK